MNISFPTNAIKDAGGVTYSGPVNVATQYIDPTSAELNKIMPGDLRGINTDGYMRGLTSFGMMAVELTGNAGQLLQIIDEKRSTITMPVPASISSNTPASIPLWYFDETNGLWKEEGTAIRIGNTYVGDVSHFSFWNIDIPNATVPISFTLTDSSGRSLGNVLFEIVSLSSNYGAHISGNTDASGYVAVSVTPNTQYQLRISSTAALAFTKTFFVGESPFSLGNIIIGNFVSLTGTITDCNNNPLLNGRVIINDGYQYWIRNVGAGLFDFSIFTNSQSAVGIVAEDLNTTQQSQVQSYTLSNGQNSIGNIQACGISTEVYLNFTINGRTFICGNQVNSTTGALLIPAPDSIRTTLYWTVVETQNGIPIPNSISNIYLFFWSFGPVSNPSTLHFSGPTAVYVPGILNSALFINPLTYALNNNYREIPINMTEYGSIGEFIAGSYSGRFYEQNGVPDLSRPFDVSCNFRIKRTQ